MCALMLSEVACQMVAALTRRLQTRADLREQLQRQMHQRAQLQYHNEFPWAAKHLSALGFPHTIVYLTWTNLHCIWGTSLGHTGSGQEPDC